MALWEEVVYGPQGHLRTRDLMSYKIPGREDIPVIRAELVESHEPSGPYGAKSVGEIGIDTPPAAIANAVAAAVGARVRELPVTPEKVLKVLSAAGTPR
jgi:CO/xanthine dehydrogenase Mo-binding subunit